MIKSFSALEASDSIRSSYLEYLLSAFDFSDDEIRTEFRDSLSNHFEISKGPYVQATPPYKRDKSLHELANDGVISAEFFLNESLVPNGDRPLYRHQVQAIERIAAGRNIIVATGTGSGKTESFLLPILDSLLREREAGTIGQPGVRAMLLYPMNALANDQLWRLRELLANIPDVTFGRFTGDTGWEDEVHLAADYVRRYGAEPLPNEMLSRDRMRETPPHILVTNFAMLEYLLIRPAETRFFDGHTGKHWKFVVLDEVHTYQGAKGGEIRMLLKRLRDRVVSSSRNRITYIGTSATIGSNEDDMPKLAKFARELFDENVEYASDATESDIIRPVSERHELPDAIYNLGSETISQLHRLMLSGDESELVDFVTQETHVKFSDESATQVLGDLLVRDKSFQSLRNVLDKGPLPLKQLAGEIEGLDGSELSIIQLIDLAKFAEMPGDSFPLLSARYHLFLRALEGMYYCFNPEHPRGEPRLSLDPRESCPSCSKDESSATFEIGPCVQCGATYIVGAVNNENEGPRLGVPATFSSDNAYLTPLFSETSRDEDGDEDEETFAAAVGIDIGTADVRILCTICGALDETDSTCSHEKSRRRFVHTKPKDVDSPLRKCVICSHQSSSPVVNRVQTGQDAPAAIIASSIYQELPPVEVQNEKMGGGRKLLCFSDSRQDAAFFAPYLERAYMRNVQRRQVLEALMASGEVLRFEDLVPSLVRRAELSQILNEDDGVSPAVTIRKWLLREALNVDGRQSLVGVGLIRVSSRLPEGTKAPVSLQNLGLSEPESVHVLQVLLGSLREKAVVDLPDSIDIKDPIFSPRNVVLRMRETSDGKILGWSPKSGRTNARLDYLEKLLHAAGSTASAREVLSNLWAELSSASGPWASLLFTVDNAKGNPSLCLNYKAFDFQLVSHNDDVFECETCRRISQYNVRNTCPRYKCTGSLQKLSDESGKRKHYQNLYLEQRPIGMRVEEHTGQLANRFAAEIQQGFVDGNINTLSCSTTFELGVDLGEIQAVLMKNVPPSAANYAQRAGRAGRRTSSTALVTTFAQRRSHDLSYFANPESLVGGVVQAPQISGSNTLIVRRHIHAIALAMYARQVVENGGAWPVNAGEFFQDVDASNLTFAEKFKNWLRSHPEELGASLKRVVDEPTMASDLSISSWGWVDELYSDEPLSEKGWMHKAELVIVDALRNLDELISTKQQQLASGELDSRRSAAVSASLAQLYRQKTTIRERRLIDFLAQRVVLPKYGFPVDVVSLDVWTPGNTDGANVDLSRDLQMGILDFAPGSLTVANKRLWETNGLRIPPDKALPEFHWRICGVCDTFRTLKEAGNDPGCEVCGSTEVLPGHRSAIVPAFGFLGKPSDQKPGESRPPKVGYVRSFFTEFGGQSPDLELIQIGNQLLEVRIGREGIISVLNQGVRNSGFDVCLKCGAAQVPTKTPKRRKAESQEKGHKRPGFSEHECKSNLVTKVLGHQFRTDAIEVKLPGRVSYSMGESVLAALLAASQKLDIPHDDLRGTTRASGDGGSGRSLVIYDAVPGGAGYARALREALPELFVEASKIVAMCSCGIETSCYGCLRSYGNQFIHERLTRRAALEIFHVLGLET
jgi:hypothetical protein